ncbi:pyridoxamine 5'-phosphate oxidase [Nocardioides luteus]|uniref:Pyridoxine/pyridoxamine 5'-phosphate oxidase n=1 Tax=Nocardioides luteus TaxID=1844 RepID=A0ABQ5T044_9ACTN|nr:pyridoxamine 5'-phosphate oxidase [Nocardioides luteus]MDR7313566.1 pyridoxamine 5'-phosphate oxidase [Nocardioides luteus]GGR68898.1 pyridoxine/pyridoxamine 5'-phosphate oxidase [Nocardioides luteus]GLJ69188.1 pyridoxine/pyridoxamine 5'-phosphate oxidase [Nocardioides luteus]
MDLAAELAAARENYTRSGLHEDDLASDPFLMFERWYAEARDAGIVEPNAMVVSTVSADGAPSSRTVLLKGFSTEGFTFFTNTASRKGSDLGANPRCAVLFPWHPLERQVRIDGLAHELSRADVEAYFAQRPRGSQLGAHASHQSSVVSGREELEEAYARVEAEFEGKPVPVPEEWGGYRVEPRTVEFWQGRPGRMHDRLVYRREDDGWRTERLAP